HRVIFSLSHWSTLLLLLDPCLLFNCLTLLFLLNSTPTTDIYTLSLHDALPICGLCRFSFDVSDSEQLDGPAAVSHRARSETAAGDRKSTRLNSSHEWISYAVFCLKKKKIIIVM